MVMALRHIFYETDLCVIGGGIAGISAAVTAARLGVKVVLIQERPVFGGNSSGEIRMWICGVTDYKFREAGLEEEIALENYYYNPTKNFNLWNAVLYGKVTAEKNITPLLNCTCFSAEKAGDKITAVTAYQMTTQTLYTIKAKYFADCSGDSITAAVAGAKYMYGRESREDYGEKITPRENRDGKTMGNSCLIQARKTDKKVEFRAPEWAEKVSVKKLKSLGLSLSDPGENFWYIELGGNLHTVFDAETVNRRLLALCLGVWDTIKNSGSFDADNFELEFLGFLPAKRESYRLVGDYVETANDLLNGGVFPDTVAYGGWALDDHNPDGFDGKWANNTTEVPNPYGIPYRCLYSANVANLFFAGRNISMTHMAMSSARVMGTCGTLGQAVGVAAYLAVRDGLSPREVGRLCIGELQQILLVFDCYLPGVVRKRDEICLSAELFPDESAEVLRNGFDRAIPGKNNRMTIKNGEKTGYFLKNPSFIRFIKVVFDSDFERKTFDMHEAEKHHIMRCNIFPDSPVMPMPKTLAKNFCVTVTDERGISHVVCESKENIRRNILIPVERNISAAELVVRENWGGMSETGIFTFELFS